MTGWNWDDFPPKNLDKLLEYLEFRYAPTEIPPCRVCGEELTISSVGGGEPTKYHCGSPEADWLFGEICKAMREADPSHSRAGGGTCEHLQHYRDSEFIDRRQGGDSYVMAVVDAVRAEPSLNLKRKIERQLKEWQL